MGDSSIAVGRRLAWCGLGCHGKRSPKGVEYLVAVKRDFVAVGSNLLHLDYGAKQIHIEPNPSNARTEVLVSWGDRMYFQISALLATVLRQAKNTYLWVIGESLRFVFMVFFLGLGTTIASIIV
ncbi:hypothetical protein [Ruegeria atlantica]|uniref:hypothetical protein n=1 Tax=Ruegeria atlantica TaxID=81569 RepID=UPI0024945CCA|nr:hypothetical protein [Ruegeria atlantica]